MILKIFWFFNIMLAGYLNAVRIVDLPKELSGEIRKAIGKCASNEKDIAEFQDFGKIQRDDKEFKQFIYCTYTTTKFADLNGRFNIDAAKSFWPEDAETVEVLKSCDKIAENPVETMFLNFKCLEASAIIGFKVVD